MIKYIRTVPLKKVSESTRLAPCTDVVQAQRWRREAARRTRARIEVQLLRMRAAVAVKVRSRNSAVTAESVFVQLFRIARTAAELVLPSFSRAVSASRSPCVEAASELTWGATARWRSCRVGSQRRNGSLRKKRRHYDRSKCGTESPPLAGTPRRRHRLQTHHPCPRGYGCLLATSRVAPCAFGTSCRCAPAWLSAPSWWAT